MSVFTVTELPSWVKETTFSLQRQVGAERGGGLQLGLHASLRTHEAAHGIVVGRVAVGDIEGGVALPERRAVEKLVAHLGGLCRGHGGIEEPGDAVVGRALAAAGNRQEAVLGQQLQAGLGLELAPDLVAARGEG